jgi:hypothetical protein
MMGSFVTEFCCLFISAVEIKTITKSWTGSSDGGRGEIRQNFRGEASMKASFSKTDEEIVD